MPKPDVNLPAETIALVPELTELFKVWVGTLDDAGASDGGPWLMIHSAGGVAIMYDCDHPYRWNDVQSAIDDLSGMIQRNIENKAPLN